ncbi:50S ribosomal protein L20 [Candidatus Microgenomates bacterium]|nr:50S ribosomal protein L20 [Candidatus Microgenomates bacterium]
MVRVKGGTITRKRHKKVLERTKGYRMTRSRLFKVANEADLHAGQYAYIGRKLRKRDFRQLWITRISEAVKKLDWSYNQFIHGLKKNNIELDRKILADLVVNDFNVFKKVVEKAKK